MYVGFYVWIYIYERQTSQGDFRLMSLATGRFGTPLIGMLVSCCWARRRSEAKPPSVRTESVRTESRWLLTEPCWSFGAPFLPNDQPPGWVRSPDLIVCRLLVGVVSQLHEAVERSATTHCLDREPATDRTTLVVRCTFDPERLAPRMGEVYKFDPTTTSDVGME